MASLLRVWDDHATSGRGGLVVGAISKESTVVVLKNSTSTTLRTSVSIVVRRNSIGGDDRSLARQSYVCHTFTFGRLMLQTR